MWEKMLEEVGGRGAGGEESKLHYEKNNSCTLVWLKLLNTDETSESDHLNEAQHYCTNISEPALQIHVPGTGPRNFLTSLTLGSGTWLNE